MSHTPKQMVLVTSLGIESPTSYCPSTPNSSVASAAVSASG